MNPHRRPPRPPFGLVRRRAHHPAPTAVAIDRRAVEATVAAIAAVQLGDGSIPWFPGGHADPWNHVEAAMAMAVGGEFAGAERAFDWLAATQQPDGSWASYYLGAAVEDGTKDANFCAYIAAGLWHHAMATGDLGLCARHWKVLERAVEAVLTLQAPGGEVYWARDPEGVAYPVALVTSSSCIHLSLTCAARAAAELGHPRPRWAEAAHRVGAAVAGHEGDFAAQERWSMDWYYPVLGGALTGPAAAQRLASRWDEFVVDGLGVRCVADRPWVTAAETCELALSLDSMGRGGEAAQLLAWAQRCRAAGGAYWTGWEYDKRAFWPVEKPTWTAAAVVLAADALLGLSPASGFFRSFHPGARASGAA